MLNLEFFFFHVFGIVLSGSYIGPAGDMLYFQFHEGRWSTLVHNFIHVPSTKNDIFKGSRPPPRPRRRPPPPWLPPRPPPPPPQPSAKPPQPSAKPPQPPVMDVVFGCSSPFFYHLIDAAKKKAASIKCKGRRKTGRKNRSKKQQNFRRLKNREDSSDFDDSWTESIATTRS